MTNDSLIEERVAIALFQHSNASSYNANNFPKWEWLTDHIKGKWLTKAKVAIAAMGDASTRKDESNVTGAGTGTDSPAKPHPQGIGGEPLPFWKNAQLSSEISDNRLHEEGLQGVSYDDSQDWYVLDAKHCSSLALDSFDKFLALVRHGAKFIDIHVRKDAKEYKFQADILKYIRKETTQREPKPVSVKDCAHIVTEKLNKFSSVGSDIAASTIVKIVLDAAGVKYE